MIKSSRNQGIFYIILAGLGFAFMTFFVRLSGDVPTLQKAFFRNAVALIFSVVMLAKSTEGFQIHKTSWPYMFLRCAFGTSGLICNFYVIDRINIADANILNKLSPFFAIIMSYFVLKEKANKIEWASVIVAFVGALFVIKPSFQIEFVYGIIGMCGGLGAGVAYSFVRKLGKMGERGAVIVMCFSAFSCLVTVPYILFNYHPMAWWQLGYLILAGCAATVGQVCITKAYTKAPAKEISVFDYTQVIFAALLGLFFLGQVPDYLSIIGYIIIIESAIFKWFYVNKMEVLEAK